MAKTEFWLLLNFSMENVKVCENSLLLVHNAGAQKSAQFELGLA